MASYFPSAYEFVVRAWFVGRFTDGPDGGYRVFSDGSPLVPDPYVYVSFNETIAGISYSKIDLAGTACSIFGDAAEVIGGCSRIVAEQVVPAPPAAVFAITLLGFGATFMRWHRRAAA